MNWRLIPLRLYQVAMLELQSWFTSGCGMGYAIRKWIAVFSNARSIQFLGDSFEYEDRLNPFTIFTYVQEVQLLIQLFDLKNRPMKVLDIGGNVGIWGWAFKNALPKAQVFSFEPNPIPFEILKRNSDKLNGWTCFNFGIGELSETLSFYYVPGKSGQGSLYKENANLNLMEEGVVIERTVEIRNLSNFKPPELKNDQYFELIKVDVEGAEFNVIPGLAGLKWRVMYAELSLDRGGAKKDSLKEFTTLVQSYWPLATLRFQKDKGTFLEVYYECF